MPHASTHALTNATLPYVHHAARLARRPGAGPVRPRGRARRPRGRGRRTTSRSRTRPRPVLSRRPGTEERAHLQAALIAPAASGRPDRSRAAPPHVSRSARAVLPTVVRRDRTGRVATALVAAAAQARHLSSVTGSRARPPAVSLPPRAGLVLDRWGSAGARWAGLSVAALARLAVAWRPDLPHRAAAMIRPSTASPPGGRRRGGDRGLLGGQLAPGEPRRLEPSRRSPTPCPGPARSSHTTRCSSCYLHSRLWGGIGATLGGTSRRPTARLVRGRRGGGVRRTRAGPFRGFRRRSGCSPRWSAGRRLGARLLRRRGELHVGCVLVHAGLPGRGAAVPR